MAENRHRTVLEIKTDQTQAEIDIKRLQDMVDQLQKAAANIGFGGGAGGGVSGASGGAAPNPPRTDSGAGGAGGGASSAPPATGGGPGGSPAGTSGASAPGGPGVGPGMSRGGPGGGGGARGGGGRGTLMAGGVAGGMAGGRMLGGLGRFLPAIGATAIAHSAAARFLNPEGSYFSPGEQFGFDMTSFIPGSSALRAAGESYGKGASEVGRLMEQAGQIDMAGFNTGLLGPGDSVTQDFLNMGYGNTDRIRLGGQLLSSAGRSFSDVNVGSAARMTRGGADVTAIGALMRAQTEYGATGALGDDPVDLQGRVGLGGIESLMATNQQYGYTGAALGELSKQQAQAVLRAEEAGLTRDVGAFAQTQSDLMRLGISGYRGADMANKTTGMVTDMVSQHTSPFGAIGKTLLQAKAMEGAESYDDIIRNMQGMDTADIVETIQQGAASPEEGALALADMMKVSMDEADQLMKFERGAGDIESQVQVQGGLDAARARALGEKEETDTIEKEDIAKLIKALSENTVATRNAGKTIHRVLGIGN